MTISLRRIWKLVTPLTIVVCAIFAAKTSANLLAQDHLADAKVARPTQDATPVQEPKRPPRPSKSRVSIIDRNMFCSGCGTAVASHPEAPQSNRTQLPLRLIATNIAAAEEDSFASVLNTSDQRQGGYRVGEEIPGAGAVVSIGRDYLSFHNDTLGRIERILFDTGPVTTKAPSRAASAATSSLAEEYVRAIDATHFEVDRKLIDKLQGNPLLGGARARPVVKEGKMQGVRLFALRSTGLAYAMGMRNGDTLVAANGVKLHSYEAALELMGQLKTKDHWSIDIQRRGKSLTLHVDLQ